MHTYAENLEAAIKHIDDRAAFISVDNGKRMWPFFFSVYLRALVKKETETLVDKVYAGVLV